MLPHFFKNMLVPLPSKYSENINTVTKILIIIIIVSLQSDYYDYQSAHCNSYKPEANFAKKQTKTKTTRFIITTCTYLTAMLFLVLGSNAYSLDFSAVSLCKFALPP